MRKILTTTALALCLCCGSFVGESSAQETNVTVQSAEMSQEQYDELREIMLKGKPEDLKKLIQNGFDVNGVYQCHTPLSMAIRGVSFAFGASATPISPDASIEKIKILIESGADVNKQPCTTIAVLPLTSAIQMPFQMRQLEKIFYQTIEDTIRSDTSGSDKCLEMLPKACSEVTQEDLDMIKYTIGQAYKNAQQSLIPYMMKTIALLVENGANVNSKDTKGAAPIHSSLVDTKVTTLEPLKYLIAKGANVNARDAEGNTPLFFAFADGDKEAVDILIKAGADETLWNYHGIRYNEVTGQTTRTYVGPDGVVHKKTEE